MKRLLLIPALCLSLGGCITVSGLTTGISLVTKSITNPVTSAEEVQMEIAVDAAIVLIKAYKAECAQGHADKNCKANVAQIQAYTRNMPGLISQLRGFVDTNNQINATVVYNQLLALYGNVKNFAATAGVNVENLP